MMRIFEDTRDDDGQFRGKSWKDPYLKTKYLYQTVPMDQKTAIEKNGAKIQNHAVFDQKIGL